MKSGHVVILFDGVCNLCNFFVNFVIDRDPKRKFRFASLQSDIARREFVFHNLKEGYFDSIVFLHGERVYVKSRAALEVLRLLGWPWKVFYILIIVPPFLRDWVYNFIAKNRYRWFGKRDSCRIPTAELQERFLDS